MPTSLLSRTPAAGVAHDRLPLTLGTALQAAVAAAQTVQLIGMPEARLALAQATVHLALAPKSNTVIVGIDEAMAAVRAGAVGEIPAHLRYGALSGGGPTVGAIPDVPGLRHRHAVGPAA